MPKEHGATVMLGASLVLGWFPAWSLKVEVIAVAAAVVGLLFLREPLVRILRRGGAVESSADRRAWGMFLIAGIVTAISGWLVLSRVSLAQLAPVLGVGAVCFSISIVASARRSAWHWWVDLAGAVAAGLPVPAMRLATDGQLDGSLYLACSLFYLGSTLHLRELLRDGPRMRRFEKMRPRRASLWSFASVGAAAAATIPAWLSLAGALICGVALLRPFLLRGSVIEDYMRIGLVETGLTVVFVLAAMIGAPI